MTENGKEWDYCKIEFRLRNKGESFAIAGPTEAWMAFTAYATGPHKNYLAGEVEFPVPNIPGVILAPQKNNTAHANFHKKLLLDLQKDGWELLPEESGSWWERRLRRPTKHKKSWLAGLKNRSI